MDEQNSDGQEPGLWESWTAPADQSRRPGESGSAEDQSGQSQPQFGQSEPEQSQPAIIHPAHRLPAARIHAPGTRI